MPDQGLILLSAGGTGGHLFPAEALAQELVARGRKVVIITDKRGHAFKTLGENVPIHTVRAATLKAGIVTKIKAVLDMGIGIVQAAVLLRKYKPVVVVGFGGYPSFPAVFAAQVLGIPTVLHEQNAVLGKANVWLVGLARDIALSLPDTRGISPANQKKSVVTGNPVRAAVVAVRDSAYPAPTGAINILITGGSQAASIFSNIVPDAMAALPDSLKKSLAVVHQAREADVAATAEKYKKAGISAEIKPFFSDMPERLRACHLFIGRSGASTVAEIAVVGRPGLFVPYQHKDRQQTFNAESVSAHGGGWILPQENFNAPALAQKLEELIKNPAILEQAATAAKACGHPDAAKSSRTS